MKFESDSALGRYTMQKVSRVLPTGYAIETDMGSAFLPIKEAAQGLNEGDEIQVCIYHDYDGHLTATTQKPHIQVGEVALLKVKAAGDKGAFADWGLPKDVFIAHAEQAVPVIKGKYYAVAAYIDTETDRIAGSTKIDKFVSEIVEPDVFAQGQEVTIVPYRRTEMGFKVLIDGAYSGMVYDNEIFKPVKIGVQDKAYIKLVREDGKIDLILQKSGFDGISDGSKVLLEQLELNDGFLPYHDKTDPYIIKTNLHMSKRIFKAAVGGLLKNNLIEIESDGIRLKKVNNTESETN